MKKVILKNIFSGLLSQFITIIYGFIVPILIIKEYGSSANGLVSSIAQFIAYINLLQLGIGPVIKKSLFEPIAKNDKEKISDILCASNLFFRRIAYFLVVYIVILCIVFPFVNNEFSSVYSISLIIIISFGTFFEYFLGMTYKLFLTSDQKNYVVDYINIFGYVISLILIYVLIKTNNSIQTVKLVGALIFLIKPLLMKKYFDKHYNIKINKNTNYSFKDKWSGFAHHIAATIQGNTDVVVLTIFSNLTNVSIYAMYNLIVTSINNIIVSLTNGIDGFFGKSLVKNESSINDNFNLYNFFFYTIMVILIGCTLVLITPFIGVYTSNIQDADYIKWSFGYVLVLAEFNYAIRYPYATLVYSKGHFKQTTKYAIIEPIVNIIVSIILVSKYGLIGVAIGTLISMPIRSFGFIYHAIKHILNESFIRHFKVILLSYIELYIIFLLRYKLLFFETNSYLQWALLAFIIFVIISISVLLINSIIIRPNLGFNKLFKRKRGFDEK